MYTDKQLGFEYSQENTVFRVFAPTRNNIKLRIYEEAQSLKREEFEMIMNEDGTFECKIERDLKGYYYTYLVENLYEISDPYSISTSLNSIRSAIIDLKDTNPDGWLEHKEPEETKLIDSIIYEVQIKDFTVDRSSGAVFRGTFNGFVEENTKCKGESTGLDHLKELGVTHIHLMPVNDFLSSKEEIEYAYKEDNYNWGYDPEHYNVVEGSFSCEPSNPLTRIIEFKKMIMKLHEAGFKVVLDVVYNHTFRGRDSNFNILVPDYYYRMLSDGTFSNGSGVGNELDTQKPMVRKFIIDSLKYWMNEFKIDGFRFDLMALIDIDTVEEAVLELREIKSDVLIYGEPWTGGITTLSDTKTTSKGSQCKVGFALFNDNFREAIKGDNDGFSLGFAQGNLDEKTAVETGIAGSIFYDMSRIGFTTNARETINYVNSHDNLILQDKLLKVFPDKSEEEIKAYNKFIHAILFFSQGIPFIHAGNEFLRTKNGFHNSYNSPIAINRIDWSLKGKNKDVFNYIKDLIQFRKDHKEFRMDTADEIRENLKFIEDTTYCNTITYTIKNNGGYLLIIHNANPFSCLVPHAMIEKHIKAIDKRNVVQLDIRCLFDPSGIVKGNALFKHPHGIEIEAVNSYVFELKIV